MSNGTNFPNGLSTLNRNATVRTKGVVHKTQSLPIKFSDGTTETDTGFNLPAAGLVTDVYLYVYTAEATGTTKTINVGLLSSESGGDADGFVIGASVAATGLIYPKDLTVVGTNETYYSSSTRGGLLSNFAAGADVATDTGLYNTFPFDIDSVAARSISWTPGSADYAELEAEIIIEYKEFVL